MKTAIKWLWNELLTIWYDTTKVSGEYSIRRVFIHVAFNFGLVLSAILFYKAPEYRMEIILLYMGYALGGKVTTMFNSNKDKSESTKP